MAIQEGNTIKFVKAPNKAQFESNKAINGHNNDAVVFIKNTKEIFLDGVYYGGNEEKIILVTYDELVLLRNNSALIPELLYELTDYECTTTLEDTRVDPNAPSFSIILIAVTSNSLSPEGKVVYELQNIFELTPTVRYNLDNDTSKFAWADESNGKGVIYRWLDRNFDIPYDINIQFKRYKATEFSNSFVNDSNINFNNIAFPVIMPYVGIKGDNIVDIDNDDFQWFNTITREGVSINTVDNMLDLLYMSPYYNGETLVLNNIIIYIGGNGNSIIPNFSNHTFHACLNLTLGISHLAGDNDYVNNHFNNCKQLINLVNNDFNNNQFNNVKKSFFISQNGTLRNQITELTHSLITSNDLFNNNTFNYNEAIILWNLINIFNNIFNVGCNNFYFLNSEFTNNKFGIECNNFLSSYGVNNIINNTFGNGCYNIEFTNNIEFYNNTIGDNCFDLYFDELGKGSTIQNVICENGLPHFPDDEVVYNANYTQYIGLNPDDDITVWVPSHLGWTKY